MSKRKMKYAKEFKIEAVKLVNEQGYKQAEAAERLGIDPKNLSRWIKEAKEPRLMGGRKSVVTEEHKELEALRKENKRLKLERDILKKAAAFFANESN